MLSKCRCRLWRDPMGRCTKSQGGTSSEHTSRRSIKGTEEDNSMELLVLVTKILSLLSIMLSSSSTGWLNSSSKGLRILTIISNSNSNTLMLLKSNTSKKPDTKHKQSLRELIKLKQMLSTQPSSNKLPINQPINQLNNQLNIQLNNNKSHINK